MTEAGNNSNTPAPGKQHQLLISIQQSQRVSLTKRRELLISIQQAQRVTLTRWVNWIGNTVAGWVNTATSWVRQGPGRPPEYDYGAITEVAQELILGGVDDYLDRFVERVRNECKSRRIKVPKRSQIRKFLKPIWAAARG
jgi:hypothetical protein